MKILISSCLLGENVRYDGLNSDIMRNDKLTFSQKEAFRKMLKNHEIFPFCPEVSSGLTVPREPVEITCLKPLKLVTKDKTDKTSYFINGAKNCLDLCKKEGIKVALLKTKSPSCGNEKIYDGTFSNILINGVGITAQMLLHNGIKVFNETQLHELNDFIN